MKEICPYSESRRVWEAAPCSGIIEDENNTLWPRSDPMTLKFNGQVVL